MCLLPLPVKLCIGDTWLVQYSLASLMIIPSFNLHYVQSYVRFGVGCPFRHCCAIWRFCRGNSDWTILIPQLDLWCRNKAKANLLCNVIKTFWDTLYERRRSYNGRFAVQHYNFFLHLLTSLFELVMDFERWPKTDQSKLLTTLRILFTACISPMTLAGASPTVWLSWRINNPMWGESFKREYIHLQQHSRQRNAVFSVRQDRDQNMTCVRMRLRRGTYLIKGCAYVFNTCFNVTCPFLQPITYAGERRIETTESSQPEPKTNFEFDVGSSVVKDVSRSSCSRRKDNKLGPE